jgi:hypothetical protein
MLMNRSLDEYAFRLREEYELSDALAAVVERAMYGRNTLGEREAVLARWREAKAARLA